MVLQSQDGNVYVWDLPADYDPDKVEWGMYLHDRNHSGTYGFDPDQGIEDGPAVDLSSPSLFSLSQNCPNPFGQMTDIRYQISVKNRVSMKIYDITGRLVRVLIDEDQKPGSYTVSWDGKDMVGRKVASGVYFYRLETNETNAVKKMIIVR